MASSLTGVETSLHAFKVYCFKGDFKKENKLHDTKRREIEQKDHHHGCFVVCISHIEFRVPNASSIR